MNDNFGPIYVDASQPATLRFAGRVLACPTLQEAVFAWRKLPMQDQEEATIRVAGTVYGASEIARLYHAAK